MSITHSTTKRTRRAVRGLAGLGTTAALLLSGCAFNNGSSVAGSGASLGQLKVTGSVFGGQQPVARSTIQLYAVGTSGAGSPSTALIASAPSSGTQGQFTITGLYSCANATQVYITATGGDSGAGSNPAIALMASLGSCSTLLANAATTNIVINELTTVASVYALAPFMTDYTHVGAAGSNPVGLLNAIAMANALVSYPTGQIQNAPAGVTLPGVQINTLADILAACINSAAGSSPCSMLFSATGATETIGAALAIAKNPGSPAITNLYALASPTAPFQPTLTSQPNDFTLPYTYSGAEFAGPYGVAIDAAGNGWITNQSGRSVTRFPNLSSAFGTTSYTGGGAILAPRGISVDRSGNIWIANTGGNNIVKLTALGAAAAGSPFTAGGLASPVAIANDSAANAWIANLNGNSITALSSTGAAVGGSPFTGGGSLNLPTGVAIDTAGNVNVSNAGSGSLSVFSNAGALLSTLTDGTLLGATGVATFGTAFSMPGSTTGAALAGAFSTGSTAGAGSVTGPVAGAGLNLPVAVTYDGAGRAWFANTSSISAFLGQTPISPTGGFGTLNAPQGIAIDPSGNVWTTNSGSNSITLFVGLASPVTTPLATSVGP